MQPQPLPTRRRNVVTFVLAGAIIVAVALVPGQCSQMARPYHHYATAAEARSGTAALPAQLPASATDIHVRYDKATGARWLRFTYDPRDLPAMTAGMRPVPPAERERIEVPNPGFSGWWLVSSRTLRGGQGEQVLVFEAPGAYMVADPRTRTGYVWTR